MRTTRSRTLQLLNPLISLTRDKYIWEWFKCIFGEMIDVDHKDWGTMYWGFNENIL